jgi:dihydrofolate reductase
MGRLTFETVLSFADWPYGTTPVVVLSRTLATLPPGIPASVTVTAEAPAELAARLGAAGMRRLYVDGGETIRAFLAADLIDEITLTTIPVLLGAGRPLFAPGTPELALELVASRHWPFGFVQNRYRLRRR